MYAVLQVGSSICPHIHNPRDTEYILIYKEDYNYTPIVNKYKTKKSSVWCFKEKEYENYSLQTIQYIWSYQIKYFKVIEGDISHFPNIHSFLNNHSILLTGWWDKHKKILRNKWANCTKDNGTKLLYHLFFTMYIIKNQDYNNFSPHQQEVLNLAHDVLPVAEQDLRELEEFLFND